MIEESKPTPTAEDDLALYCEIVRRALAGDVTATVVWLKYFREPKAQ